MKNLFRVVLMIFAIVVFTGCVSTTSTSEPTLAPLNSISLGYGQPSVAVGDITGDGLNDIVYADKNGINMVTNLGEGKFAAPINITNDVSLGYGQPSVAVGDITGDGLNDIVYADKNGISVLVNHGDSMPTNPIIIFGDVSLGYGQPTVAIGDLNGDGLIDITVGDKNGLVVLLNSGSNTFEPLR